jgi:hypothetical protein
MKKIGFVCLMMLIVSVRVGAAYWDVGAGGDVRFGKSPSSILFTYGPEFRVLVSPFDHFEAALTLYSGALIGSQYSLRLDALGVFAFGPHWVPAIGFCGGLTFGSSLDMYQNGKSISAFFFPFISAGITVIPARFEMDDRRFSFLEFSFQTDLAQFGSSIIIDARLLTLSVLFGKETDRQRADNSFSNSRSEVPLEWYLSLGVGGLVAGVWSYGELAVPPAVTLRSFDLIEVTFSVKWLPIFNYLSAFSLEADFSPGIADYRPAIGVGVSCVLSSLFPVPDWTPYISLLPARFRLDGLFGLKETGGINRAHSLYISFLETRFGPFLSLPPQNKLQYGAFYLSIDIVRFGYEL